MGKTPQLAGWDTPPPSSHFDFVIPFQPHAADWERGGSCLPAKKCQNINCFTFWFFLGGLRAVRHGAVIGNEYSQAFLCGCTLSTLPGTHELASPCVLVTGWGAWTLP
jgi:hypothetical protein